VQFPAQDSCDFAWVAAKAESTRRTVINFCQCSSVGHASPCSHFRTVRVETPSIFPNSGWERSALMRCNSRWSPRVLTLTGMSFRVLNLCLKLPKTTSTVRCAIPSSAPNRRWRLQFRCRGSRRESAVAQLFSLGSKHTL